MDVQVYKNFIDPATCGDLVETVLQHRADWIQYNTDISVWGNSYFRHLVAVEYNTYQAEPLYYSKPNTLPPEYKTLLLRSFSGLFKQVAFIPRFGIPGFQIIQHTAPRIWHYDDEKIHYPYRSAFPEYVDIDYFDQCATFTIMCSAGNFTYDYTDESKSVYSREHLGKQQSILAPEKYKTINYGVGDMILTYNRYLHRVGISDYTKDKQRISIQGHIVTKGSLAYLYW